MQIYLQIFNKPIKMLLWSSRFHDESQILDNYLVSNYILVVISNVQSEMLLCYIFAIPKNSPKHFYSKSDSFQICFLPYTENTIMILTLRYQIERTNILKKDSSSNCL